MNPRILIVRVIYIFNIEVNRSFSSNVTYIIKVDSTMKRTYTRCATSKGSVKTGSMRNGMKSCYLVVDQFIKLTT